MIESAEEFRRLRSSEDPAEYERAAQEEAPLEVWHDVIARMPDMRQWVVNNKTVPVSILEQLIDDPDDTVRSFIATKRKLPEELQLRMTRDPDPSIRVRLANNAKVTPAVLEILAKDADPWVREQVAEIRGR